MAELSDIDISVMLVASGNDGVPYVDRLVHTV